MDLNNLNLPPDRHRDLQRILDQAHKNYIENLDNLTDAATYDMETVLSRDPLSVQELVQEYTRDASQLANDYYDTVRETWQEYADVDMPDFEHTDLIDSDRVLWQVQGGFNDTDFNGLTYTQVKSGQSRAGKNLQDLWPDFTNLDTAQQFIGDMIMASSRLTVQRNVHIDPTKPRWARVPRGAKTCAFCAMLASRGFAYLSEDSAGRQMQYHTDCDCAIVPSWGKQTLKGYDPDSYLEMWNKADKDTDGSDYREILKTMRRQNPETLKDGFKPLTKPWPEDVRHISGKVWNHIILGNDGKGGHSSHANVTGKSHFPKSWDDDQIKWAIKEAIVDPDSPITRAGSFEYRRKTIDNVKIAVKLIERKNGYTVSTAYPDIYRKGEAS